MLYRFVKILMRAALGLFYKEILQRRLDLVPANGPALLIANHPSSLMDAALLGILLKRPVHFFARGDIFINPVVIKILNALHMYPVHHHHGGRQTLGANDAAFGKAIDLLLHGQMVLFFPEGTSHIEYRLWDFRKGAFRIALQTIQKNPALNLPIVPIGINYSHPTKLFSRVWVQAGPPFLANDWLPAYSSQPSVALKQLTAQGFTTVKDLVVDAGPESTGTLFQVLETWRNSNQIKYNESVDPIINELQISKDFKDWQPAAAEQVAAYQEALKNAGVSDASIKASNAAKLSASPLVIGFPAALIGWAMNGLPLLLARKIADQKVKRADFYSWILVTSAAFFYVFWFAIIALLVFIFLPAWKAMAVLFIMVSTGQYSWNYYAYYLNWKTQQDGLRLTTTIRESLTKQQQSILATITSPS